MLFGNPTLSQVSHSPQAVTITLTAHNSVAAVTKVLTLVVEPAPFNNPQFESANMATFITGAANSFMVTAVDGSPSVTYGLVGALPHGVQFDPATGMLSGNPTTPGKTTLSFSVTSPNGHKVAQSFTLEVKDLVVSGMDGFDQKAGVAILTEAEVGVPYSHALSVSGGTGPYTWKLMQGSSAATLPHGLSFNAATATMSGSPTAKTPTPVRVEVKVTDSSSPARSEQLPAEVIVATVPPQITSPPTVTFVTGRANSFTVQTTGAPPPTLTEQGSLPSGVTFNPSTGLLSGTPAGSGTWSLSFGATNSQLQTKQAFALVLAPMKINVPTITDGQQRLPLDGATLDSVQLSAQGGTGPYTWSISAGHLPAGMTLSPSTGTISGSPAYVSGAGNQNSYTVTVKVINKAGSLDAVRTLDLVVGAASLSLTSASLPVATRGSPYAAMLTAQGRNAPYGFVIAGGALPKGSTLSPATGAITGTPNASDLVGTYVVSGSLFDSTELSNTSTNLFNPFSASFQFTVSLQ